MRDFSHVKNMIVKIGSSSLCNAEGNIDTEKILGFIEQIAKIRRQGIQIVLFIFRISRPLQQLVKPA